MDKFTFDFATFAMEFMLANLDIDVLATFLSRTLTVSIEEDQIDESLEDTVVREMRRTLERFTSEYQEKEQ